MNIEEYQNKSHDFKENLNLNEHIFEMIELFCDLANIKVLSYYKYEYEYNDFFHQITLNDNGQQIEVPNNKTKKYKILLRDKKVVFGYFLIDERIKATTVVKKLLKKIIKYLKNQKELQKRLYGNDVPFNIYIINDDL